MSDMPAPSQPRTRAGTASFERDGREILLALRRGQVHLAGEFLWGSNHTFLVQVEYAETRIPAVYKPQRGERPLWDFPRGTLAAREVAAYVTSQALGWDIVPPTVLRQEGPSGPGSLQFFVDADPEHHYFTFSQDEKQRLRPAAIFDLLVNNADRKAGHVLIDRSGHLWLIDHGVCFHQEPKLRTVIWDFVGETFPEAQLRDLAAFHRRLLGDPDLRARYNELLSPSEVEALIRRVEALLRDRRFPEPGPGRPYPWPLV